MALFIKEILSKLLSFKFLKKKLETFWDASNDITIFSCDNDAVKKE